MVGRRARRKWSSSIRLDARVPGSRPLHFSLVGLLTTLNGLPGLEGEGPREPKDLQRIRLVGALALPGLDYSFTPGSFSYAEPMRHNSSRVSENSS
jgi:hypothetical protein